MTYESFPNTLERGILHTAIKPSAWPVGYRCYTHGPTGLQQKELLAHGTEKSR